jgi:hypothetical protein
MDDANTADRSPAPSGEIESTQQPDRDRLTSISQACSVMKDEIANTAQHLIGGNERLGKPPTISQACSTMKGEIDDEARQILAAPLAQAKPQTFTAACESIRAETVETARQIVPNANPEPTPTSTLVGAGDTDERFDREGTEDARFYLHPIEQAKKAIRESQWFEQ